MKRQTFGILLAGLTAACAWGCGGAKQPATDGASGRDATPVVQAADTAAAADSSVYMSHEDPDAIYTAADLPGLGSYLKVDFTGLSAAQVNRVLHRLRTENCTCGCPDTIDECLVKDPQCDTAVTLAGQIVREEKLKP